MIPPGTINFRAVDLNDVLTLYAELVGKTILRPTSLPAVVVTLKTQTPLTKPEAVQALEAVLALNGISIIPAGEKFVKVVPSANANQAGAALNEQKAKDLPELGSYVTHVVQLKYVKPSELQQVLTPFASQIPNPILPIDGSQMLVLRDYTENVKRMLEMIEKIDVAVPAEFISEVIPIKYALASDISAALNALSAGGGGTTVGGGAGGGGTSRGGGRTGSAFGSQRTLGGTGVGGSYPGTYGTTPGIGQQATQSPVGGTTPGTGGTFSDRLRSIIQRAGGGGPGEIQVIGTTKIIADERTNSLLIFASKTDMETIKKIIAQLDVVLAQVLIETVIIEYTLGPDTKNFGFTYVQHPQSVGNFNSVGTAGGGQFFNPGSFLGIGTNSAQGLADGFNYLFTFGQDLDVTVSAVEASSKGKVLQRPRIQTSHAVPAQIFVGESRPYPQGSYYGGGSFGGYSTIQQLQIGVTLEVTPLINPDGLVVMDIHQTIENYAGFTDITGVGQVPITTRKEASAKVAVRDRDTIMLGGLIETDKSKSHSGVPFLMDVPLLGFFFRSTSTSDTRKELIVLIRPSVLPTPEVAALTARSEKEKMAGVRETEREIMEENAARLKEADRHQK
jgi:general secretion pathway protein D